MTSRQMFEEAIVKHFKKRGDQVKVENGDSVLHAYGVRPIINISDIARFLEREIPDDNSYNQNW